MLAALAYSGFAIGEGMTAWLLGLALPATAATLWGLLLAPKAKRQLGDPAKLGMEVLIFGGAVTALLAAGSAALALALATLVTVHLALSFVLGQR